MLGNRFAAPAFFFLACFIVGLALSVAPEVKLPIVHAQSSTVQVMDAFGYESISVTGTAVGFTSATIVPTGQVSARAAECTTETASIRYRYDGTSPTSSEGHVVATDSSFTVYGINNIRRFRAIAVSATATVKCTYLR